jgi:hypothetical protein
LYFRELKDEDAQYHDILKQQNLKQSFMQVDYEEALDNDTGTSEIMQSG